MLTGFSDGGSMATWLSAVFVELGWDVRVVSVHNSPASDYPGEIEAPTFWAVSENDKSTVRDACVSAIQHFAEKFHTFSFRFFPPHIGEMQGAWWLRENSAAAVHPLSSGAYACTSTRVPATRPPLLATRPRPS